MPASPLVPPHFAAVTVVGGSSLTSPGHSSLSSPVLARDITLTLHLPQDLVATVTGVDADALTVVLLDLIRATTRTTPT